MRVQHRYVDAQDTVVALLKTAQDVTPVGNEAIVASNLFCERLERMTLAPNLALSRAISNPIRLLPPMINTFCSFKL